MANYNTTKNFIYDLAATVFFLSTYYLMMPVFPIYMMELGIDKLTIGIIMGLFSISSMVSRPLGGIWVDAMGRRKLMFFFDSLVFHNSFIFELSGNLDRLHLGPTGVRF